MVKCVFYYLHKYWIEYICQILHSTSILVHFCKDPLNKKDETGLIMSPKSFLPIVGPKIYWGSNQ